MIPDLCFRCAVDLRPRVGGDLLQGEAGRGRGGRRRRGRGRKRRKLKLKRIRKFNCQKFELKSLKILPSTFFLQIPQCGLLYSKFSTTTTF